MPKAAPKEGIKPDIVTNQVVCTKCNRSLAKTNFYSMANNTVYPMCKGCLTMHINNWEPDTYLWILQEFDVPYVEDEWVVLRDRAYAKDPYKITGMSVLGKYLAKMKLKQWSKYGWEDTEAIKEEIEKRREAEGLPSEQLAAKLEEIKEAYENGEISEAQYKTFTEQHQEPVVEHAPDPSKMPREEADPMAGFEEVEIIDVGADLTDEDKVYLAMKWGRMYRADEWVSLEQLYNEFMNTFDIQGAARIDTLKMICKTSLKMNQAIDCGDVDSYQKLSRVYDAMMKSAKFTEAQNKEGKGDFLDSVGEMVAYCEKNGGQIPKYKIDVPYDVVDKIIDDLKLYNKTLIYEDKSLAEEIENYLKNREIAENMRRDRENARAQGLDYVELDDNDYAEFNEHIESMREADAALDQVEGDES